jgi:hypothetical protein
LGPDAEVIADARDGVNRWHQGVSTLDKAGNFNGINDLSVGIQEVLTFRASCSFVGQGGTGSLAAARR